MCLESLIYQFLILIFFNWPKRAYQKKNIVLTQAADLDKDCKSKNPNFLFCESFGSYTGGLHQIYNNLLTFSQILNLLSFDINGDSILFCTILCITTFHAKFSNIAV